MAKLCVKCVFFNTASLHQHLVHIETSHRLFSAAKVIMCL